MKKKHFIIIGFIAVLGIFGFTTQTNSKAKQEDPITALTKKVSNLQGQVTTLKQTVSGQKEDFNQQISDLQTTISSQKKQISDLERVVSTQKKQVDDALLIVLPVGSVVAFAREANQIPSGWVLCDGRTVNDANSIYNGFRIPNLQSHFIRGKSSREALMAKGGKDKVSGHRHTMSHTHEYTTNENRGGFMSSTITYLTLDRSIPNGNAFTNHSQKVAYFKQKGDDYDGYHQHWGTTNSTSSSYTGYSDDETNIPEYVALNYIIKIK